jgi:hypothetical protein
MHPQIKFWLEFSTGLVASVVILTQGVQARDGSSSGQPAPPPAVPVRAPSQVPTLGLMTVVTEIAYLSGQPARIQNVRVHEVISPRLFTIEPANMPSSHLGRYGAYGYGYNFDNRALVVLGTPPSVALRRGVAVEVVGEPWSLFEAQVRHDSAGLSELDAHEARRLEHKPVIHADMVRTPGGVEIYPGR